MLYLFPNTAFFHLLFDLFFITLLCIDQCGAILLQQNLWMVSKWNKTYGGNNLWQKKMNNGKKNMVNFRLFIYLVWLVPLTFGNHSERIKCTLYFCPCTRAFSRCPTNQACWRPAKCFFSQESKVWNHTQNSFILN